MATPSIINEKFEAAGYDVLTTDETVSAGCTLNEDYATSSLSPAPTGWGWGNQCLQAIIDTASDNAYDEHALASAPLVSYWRVEFMCTAQSVATWETCSLLTVFNAAWGQIFSVGLHNDGGTVKIRFYRTYDSVTSLYAAFAVNTYYRVEIQWDLTGNTWAWRLNGVAQSDGTLTVADAAGSPKILYIGATNQIVTVYIDNLGIDATTWIGGEGSIVPQMMNYYRRLRT